jgi:hypothetical protein
VQQRNAIHSRCKTAVGSGKNAAIAASLAGAKLLGDVLKHMTLMNRLLVAPRLLPRPPAKLETEDHQTSDLAEIQYLPHSAAVTAAAPGVFLFPFVAIAAQSIQKTLLCALASRQQQGAGQFCRSCRHEHETTISKSKKGEKEFKNAT